MQHRRHAQENIPGYGYQHPIGMQPQGMPFSSPMYQASNQMNNAEHIHSSDPRMSQLYMNDAMAKSAAPPPKLSTPPPRKPKMSQKTKSRLARYYAERFIVEDPLTPQQQVEKCLDSKPVMVIIMLSVLFGTVLTFAELFGIELDPTFVAQSDMVLMVIFTVEVTIRIVAMGPGTYFKSGQCMLDFAVTALDYLILFAGTASSLEVFRALRACRLARVSRMTRIGGEAGPAIETDSVGRIVKYDPAQLFSLGFLYNMTGSVTMMPEIWVQFLFLLIATTIWAVNICKEECDPDSKVYDVDFDECSNCVIGMKASTGLMFSSLVAFLLGLFDSMTFARWWSTRVLFGNLFEEVRMAAALITIYTKGNNETSMKYRGALVRYMHLAAHLFYKQIEDTEDFRDLLEQNILTNDEWDILEGHDGKPYRVYAWTIHLLSHMAKGGRLFFTGGIHAKILTSIQKQRQIQGEIMMYMDTQIPYTYTHLMTLIVKVHLVFVSGVAGDFVAKGVHRSEPLMIVMGYVIMLLNNTVLEGLLRIHAVLYDPFGEDPCDFPATRYYADMHRDCTTILFSDRWTPSFAVEDLPDPPEPQPRKELPEELQVSLQTIEDQMAKEMAGAREAAMKRRDEELTPSKNGSRREASRSRRVEESSSRRVGE